MPIRLASCSDWRKGDIRARYEAVQQIRQFAESSVGSANGRGAIIDDKKAYELFDHYCANRFARGFKLYKLYTRAAAFSGH